jgi:hypothetical protein
MTIIITAPQGWESLKQQWPAGSQLIDSRAWLPPSRLFDALHLESFASTSSFAAAEVLAIVSSLPDPTLEGSPLPTAAASFALIGDADVIPVPQREEHLDQIQRFDVEMICVT